MSIDRTSVNKCHHVSVTWLEKTQWKHDTHKFRNIFIDANEQIVPVETRRANQRWMTNEILDMMEERRLLKIIMVYIDRRMLKFRE